MSPSEWIEDSITLCGREVPARSGSLPQADLRFYPDNPRVYSIVRAGGDEPDQGMIEKKLGAMEHVKQLVQSIRANGGLTDPLIVRDGDYVVLEGNSRLAAYRLLAKLDPIKWGMVKVKLLPRDVTEDVVFALLGEYHIIGRKDWAPYEQAGYLYRRNKVHGLDLARMAQELGISKKAAGHLINVYSFMVENQDNDVTHWSYYEEYFKSNAIKKVRREKPTLDRVVVDKIASGEIARAVDVRDKLVPIIDAGGKVLNQFLDGKKDFEGSYVVVSSRGVDEEWYRRFRKFRLQIVDQQVRKDLLAMNEAPRKKCLFELRKIRQGVDSLLSHIE